MILTGLLSANAHATVWYYCRVTSGPNDGVGFHSDTDHSGDGYTSCVVDKTYEPPKSKAVPSGLIPIVRPVAGRNPGLPTSGVLYKLPQKAPSKLSPSSPLLLRKSILLDKK